MQVCASSLAPKAWITRSRQSLQELRDVRIAWMDERNPTKHWNVYYRTSRSGETILSTFVSGYSYIFFDGFNFPFEDYFDLTIDYQNRTQAAWGEGGFFAN